MLIGIDQKLTGDVLHALMSMGHGDELLLCDINHPAASISKHTTLGKVIDLAGCDIPQAARAILKLMPLDTFVKSPVTRMQVVGDPTAEVAVAQEMQLIIDEVFGSHVEMQAVERFDFYEAARRSFCVLRTSDSGPYGCFLLKKGVVDLPRL